MSYTLVMRPAAKDEAVAAIDDAHVNSDDPWTPEAEEQVAALKEAVKLLLPVVGGDQHSKVQIEISGHANVVAPLDTADVDARLAQIAVERDQSDEQAVAALDAEQLRLTDERQQLVAAHEFEASRDEVVYLVVRAVR